MSQKSDNEFVLLSLASLVRILGSAVVAVETGDGELGADKDIYETMSDIDSRSQIKIAPEELDSIMFHIAQAMLNQRGLCRLFRNYASYREAVAEIAALNPEWFEWNEAAEEFQLKEEK